MIVNVNGIEFDLRLSRSCIDFYLNGEAIGAWLPHSQKFAWHYAYGSRGRDFDSDEDIIAQPTLNMLKDVCSRIWDNRAFS